MGNKINVLITSAGTASAISVIKALRKQDEYPIRIIAVDADCNAPGLFMADRRATVPRISDKTYMDCVKDTCKEYGIRFLIPTHDTEIGLFALMQNDLDRMGIKTLLPSADVVSLCNDKQRISERVASIGIGVPEFIDPRVFYTEMPLPLIVKGNNGNSGGMVIQDMVDLGYAATKYPRYLYQRFIKGTEYTVDILCNRQSKMVVCSPRIRMETKAGICTKGITKSDPSIRNICERICEDIGFVGPGNIQFIRSAAEYLFIDFNPRHAAGGLMLTVMAGANIPFLSLQIMMGRRFSVPKIQEGLFMTRYWEEVFV